MNGYRQAYAPSHPRASASGCVQAHILVAERALGHHLPPGAEVHHVDGNPLNNAPRNLVICQDAAYHKLLHVRQRTLAAGGNPNTEKVCRDCGTVKLFAQFNAMTANRSNGRQSVCRHCSRVRNRAYRRRLTI